MNHTFKHIVLCYQQRVDIPSALLFSLKNPIELLFRQASTDDKITIWTGLLHPNCNKRLFGNMEMIQWAYRYPEHQELLSQLYASLFVSKILDHEYIHQLPETWIPHIVALAAQQGRGIPHPSFMEYAKHHSLDGIQYDVRNTYFYGHDLSQYDLSFWHHWFNQTAPSALTTIFPRLLLNNIAPNVMAALVDYWFNLEKEHFANYNIDKIITLEMVPYLLKYDLFRDHIKNVAHQCQKNVFNLQKSFDEHIIAYPFLPPEKMVSSILYLGGGDETIDLALCVTLFEHYAAMQPQYECLLQSLNKHLPALCQRQIDMDRAVDVSVAIAQSILDVDPAIYSIETEWEDAIQNDKEIAFLHQLERMINQRYTQYSSPTVSEAPLYV